MDCEGNWSINKEEALPRDGTLWIASHRDPIKIYLIEPLMSSSISNFVVRRGRPCACPGRDSPPWLSRKEEYG